MSFNLSSILGVVFIQRLRLALLVWFLLGWPLFSMARAERPPASVAARNWDAQVSLLLTENRGIPRHRELVAFSAREVVNALGALRADARSLRVVYQGRIIPSQVDEKDEQGEYTLEGNYLLDAGDEICFQVSLPANASRACTLFLSRRANNPALGPAELSTENNPALTRQKPYHLLLKNRHIEVGLCGFETPSSKQDQWRAWHPGTISYLKKGDANLLYAWRPNCNVPSNVAWPSEPLRPRLVARGPVRLIARAAFAPGDLDWHKKANWGRDGAFRDVRRAHLFSLAANSRDVDITVTLKYAEALAKPFREVWHYMNVFLDPKGLQPDQVVYFSTHGEPRQAGLDELNAHMINGKLENHQSLDSTNQDGWIAQLSPSRRVGLALFGVPGLDTMRATFFKGFSFGNANYPASVYCVYSVDQVPYRVLKRQYRLRVLENESLEECFQRRGAFLHPIRVKIP